MKTRFSTIDIRATLSELNQKFLGMRVVNVYDIDSKSYLIKLARPDQKAVLLLESGNRIHSTEFNWPKNMSPSGFSMKLRKHLRSRRLEKIEQLGVDRIIDLQFGSSEAAYHVILELYDRGNIVLTDHEYTILNILRPRTDQSQDVRFAVREHYSTEGAKQAEGQFSSEKLLSILSTAKDGDNLKKTLNPHVPYGPALLEHCLRSQGFKENICIGKEFHIQQDLAQLVDAMQKAEELLDQTLNPCKGYIIQKAEKKAQVKADETAEDLLTFSEFHPLLFKQHENMKYLEYESFDKCVDEFFSQIGAQKLDMKLLQQEKLALKKLDNIKKDHEKRVEGLQKDQEVDFKKGQLIEMNLTLVDRAITIVRSAIANQIDWSEIDKLVKDAKAHGDPVAQRITGLQLQTNHITMLLMDPYDDSEEEEGEEEEEDGAQATIKPLKVRIDLELSAYSNARKYFDLKKGAAKKEQKTVDASGKALKSAERKTMKALKEVQTVATINKARKTHWFEKFLWFISSENFVVIGGRDGQQNDYIVKRYLTPGDLYVHADLHGASSVIIKNPTGEPVPPKTLNEAGVMALCNSAAWDAKVVTSAWWVYHDQVSKTAPSGEYLSTGSFMVRGKKNFLPPSYLVYGFALVFKVDEDSVFRHRDERKVRTLEEDTDPLIIPTESEVSEDVELPDLEEDEEEDHEEEEEDDQEEEEEEEEEKDTAAAVAAAPAVQEESSEDEGGPVFPDTNITLAHVEGGRFEFQRTHNAANESSTQVYLGDDQPVSIGTKDVSGKSGSRLSAKQKRENKKKSKQNKGFKDEEGEEQEKSVTLLVPKEEGTSRTEEASGRTEADSEKCTEADSKKCTEADSKKCTEADSKKCIEADSKKCIDTEADSTKCTEAESEAVSLPQKRGRKSKLRKMKDKYKDQDDEERELRMQILASAGQPKEEKKKIKNKDKQKQKAEQRKQNKLIGPGAAYVHRHLTVEDIHEETLTVDDKGPAAGTVAAPPGEDEALSDDEKNEGEDVPTGQDVNILDSLTGQPDPEDVLLFCVTVCAPYNVLLNYKYRVKLTPGSTKRGKAAKTAVAMFQHDKAITPREKDLIKSLKDVDVSRNMPGKVKVSAPHLQKQKKR